MNLFMMLGRALSNHTAKNAWHRFSPRAKPYVGLLRNSFSTLSKQTQLGQEVKSRLVSKPLQYTRGNRGITGSPSKGGDNTVVFVGLGALGLATIVAVQSNIFSLDNKPKKSNDGPPETPLAAVPVVAEEEEIQGTQDQVDEVGEEEAVLGEPATVVTENQEGKEGNADAETSVEENIQSTIDDAPAVEIKDEESLEPVNEEVVLEESPNENIATSEVIEPDTQEPTEVKGDESLESVKEEALVDGTSDEGIIAIEATELKTQEPKVEETPEPNQAELLAVEKAVKKESYKNLPKVPEYVPYVIIGGGTASHAACRAIRKHDPKAKILVIGEEEVLPYMRPPLSKELWYSDDEDSADTLFFKQWNGKRRSVFFEDDTYYVKPQMLPVLEEGGVAVLTGQKVVNVDPAQHTVQLKHGEGVKYEKLLIATGGHPKNIAIFTDASNDMKSKVTLFRTVADYRKLEKLMGSLDSVAIIGGGFLGSELACALGSRGKTSGMEVSQIYHESGNMGKILPNYLSEWTTRKVQNEGVKTHANAQPVNAELNPDGKVSIHLDNGEKVDASHVIVCVGIEPNTELAVPAGLELDPEHGGFRVNSELQARSDIWVAGDAACFFDEKLGRRRVEHHDHAVVSGRLAGANMTGAKKSYLHQSMFWSDLGPNVGYEAIGIVDNTLDTVGVWAKATKEDTPKAVVEATGESLRSQTEEDAETGESVAIPVNTPGNTEGDSSEDFGKGVVFYMKNQVIVGVLLWNVFNKMPVARKILKEGKKQDSLVEVAKLFNINE